MLLQSINQIKKWMLEISPKSHVLGELAKFEKAIPLRTVKKLKWKKLISFPGDIVIFNDKTAHSQRLIFQINQEECYF